MEVSLFESSEARPKHHHRRADEARNVLFDSTVRGRKQRSGQVQAPSHTADTGTPSSHCFLPYPECGCPVSGAAPPTSGSLPPGNGTPCGPQVKQTKAPGKKTT